MSSHIEVDNRDVEKLYKKLHQVAESSGYHLNPDVDFTKDIVRGLLVNEQRYGYQSCPCRLASGKKSEDLDIICPCDYRDPDLNDHDMCYCALYVSNDIIKGKKDVQPIPERRLLKENSTKHKATSVDNLSSLSKPVWRCRVCGYLCGRDDPPEVCPICGAKKERFERFI